jgi:hypothetical protein
MLAGVIDPHHDESTFAYLNGKADLVQSFQHAGVNGLFGTTSLRSNPPLLTVLPTFDRSAVISAFVNGPTLVGNALTRYNQL